jgi:flagellar biosynthesis/type III secretory pathway chaperone
MNEASEIIATALRAEIEEYGSLLGLFEEQQQMLFARQAERVLEINFEIEATTERLAALREHREQLVAEFARSAGQPAGSTLRSVLGFFASEVRPLFEALIREVNLLVHRVRQTSRHNRILLQRAIQSQQEILRAMDPGRFVQTYSAAGRVGVAAGRSVATLEVAG